MDWLSHLYRPAGSLPPAKVILFSDTSKRRHETAQKSDEFVCFSAPSVAISKIICKFVDRFSPIFMAIKRTNRCLYNSDFKSFIEADSYSVLGHLHDAFHGQALTTTDEAWLAENH